MTKQQILAEIAAKIDGQGSAIDAGSALPGILRGILDLIPAEQVNSDWDATEGVAEILNKPTIPEGVKNINLTTWRYGEISGVSKSEFALALGCSEADVDEIFADNVGQLTLSIGAKGIGYKVLKVGSDLENHTAFFGSNPGNTVGFGAMFTTNGVTYSANGYEI